MKNVYFSLIILLIFNVLVACSGSKRVFKKAQELEKGGLHEEAAEMYLDALNRNNENIGAKIGLKRTGQIFMDNILGNVFKGHNTQNHKLAVNSYLDAQKFNDKVKVHNIKLSIPSHYEQYFSESKEKYLTYMYNKGQDELTAENFDAANQSFDEIIRIEPSYKDIKTLKTATVNEPDYRRGQNYLQNKEYKLAYNTFNRVYQNEATYKEVGRLREKARKEATLTISVLPVQRNRTFTNYDEEILQKVQAGVTQELLAAKSPFLEIVDRENMERILEEQKLGLSGAIKEGTAVRLGELLGVKAILVSKIVDIKVENGSINRENKVGFTRYFEKTREQVSGLIVNVPRYRETTYNEHSGTKTVTFYMQYDLISTETGKILVSNLVTETRRDKVNYITYDGEKASLFPSRGGLQAIVREERKEEFDALFDARRQFANDQQMIAGIYNEVSESVARGVLAFVR